MNTCPVYRKIGGHAFPWIYSGPIGAILTPQFLGVSHEPKLPFASSLCGACGEVCPVKIDIPQVLLDLRSDVKKSETREGQNRWERLGFRVFAWAVTKPRLFAMGGWLMRHLPMMNIGPVRAWTSERALPPMPKQSFRALWKARAK